MEWTRELLELEADGPSGHIEALPLRLQPRVASVEHQFANSRAARWAPPRSASSAMGAANFMTKKR
jgi:hypothetical protein